VAGRIINDLWERRAELEQIPSRELGALTVFSDGSVFEKEKKKMLSKKLELP
jgi:hypothetical protein